MDSRSTINQDRRLAEGLLRRAIEAPKDQNNDLLRDALRYLAHARGEEEQQDLGEAATAIGPESETQDNIQNQYRQVRQLIKQALEAIPSKKSPCMSRVAGESATGLIMDAKLKRPVWAMID